MRGGTSNAVVFHRRDLPADRAEWDEIFLAAMGSPDPNARQLNGTVYVPAAKVPRLATKREALSTAAE